MGILSKLAGLFGNGGAIEPADDQDLEAWNRIGRAKNRAVCAAFEAIIERDESSDEDLVEDEREEELADAVLARVVALNAAGDWRQARARFDPAHRPFIPHMDDTGLGAVLILGADRFLLRRGDAVLHIDGDAVEELPGVHAFALSRDRRWLALARAEGLVVQPGLDAPAGAVRPWPEGLPVDASGLRSLEIANDGQTLAMAGDAIGIWLLQGEQWMALAPRPGVGEREEEAEEGDKTPLIASPSSDEACGIHVGSYAQLRARFGSELGLDACHVALSPDGRWVAYGWQDAYPGHYVDRIDGPGLLAPQGQIAARSDYPYALRFSDDSRQLLSNSRHRQSGTTVCRSLASMGRDDDDSDEVATDEYRPRRELYRWVFWEGLERPVRW